MLTAGGLLCTLLTSSSSEITLFAECRKSLKSDKIINESMEYNHAQIPSEHWEAWALLCNSSYRYPEDCTLQDCEYQVRWSVQKDAGEVTFHIIAHSINANMWTGIGFNMKGAMDGADLVLGGYLDNGTFLIRDMTSNQYAISADSKSDIYDTSSAIDSENNKSFLMIKFKRKLDTKDSNQDKSLTNCLKFLYPVWPGKINSNGQFSMHTRNPLVSAEDMCLAACSDLVQNGSSGGPLQADQPANINTPPNPTMNGAAGPSMTTTNAQGTPIVPIAGASQGSSIIMMASTSPMMMGVAGSSGPMMGSAVMSTTAMGGSTMMMVNQSRTTVAPVGGAMSGNMTMGGGTNSTAGNQTTPGNFARIGREGNLILYTAAFGIVSAIIWQF